MADDSKSSTGETSSQFLEKVSPKDLVMFSPATRKVIAKNDLNYLGNDYDIQLPDQADVDNIRVWGLPYIKINDPAPLGLITGFVAGSIFNLMRRRPVLTSIHFHLLTSLAVGLTAKVAYKKFDEMKVERELVIWDYVKRHPQDFPEVFNAPKKYQDMLLAWRPVR